MKENENDRDGLHVSRNVDDQVSITIYEDVPDGHTHTHNTHTYTHSLTHTHTHTLWTLSTSHKSLCEVGGKV